MPSIRCKKQRKTKEPTPNWLDLPLEIWVNIFFRVGVFDILEHVQKVCTTWRKICKDEPTMWTVINLNSVSWCPVALRKMCKTAVDRSQGELVDISMVDFCDAELLEYIADRSSKLRCLEITYSHWSFHGLLDSWTKVLMKFPLLEKLTLCQTEISKEGIEMAGHYCPMLKTFKMNRACGATGDQKAIAIGENLPQLRHLEITWNSMTNVGLQVILDGCPELESLDVSMCVFIDLKGEFAKKYSRQIKCLKLIDGVEASSYHDRDIICLDFTTPIWWENHYWWDNQFLW